MKNVATFGIHHDNDHVAWLMQADGGQNAIGLNEKAPFKVRAKECNHQIDLEIGRGWEEHAKEAQQQMSLLEKLLIPVPRTGDGVYYCQGDDDSTLSRLASLSRMSAPVMPIVLPLYHFHGERGIFDELNQSNIQPLILYGIRSDATTLMRALGSSCTRTPRRLILLGREDLFLPLGVKRFNNLVLNYRSVPATDQWEAIGAALLRKHMTNG